MCFRNILVTLGECFLHPKRNIVESSAQLDSFYVLETYRLFCPHNVPTRLFPQPNKTFWKHLKNRQNVFKERSCNIRQMFY